MRFVPFVFVMYAPLITLTCRRISMVSGVVSDICFGYCRFFFHIGGPPMKQIIAGVRVSFSYKQYRPV